jgi:hypothetical protein
VVEGQNHRDNRFGCGIDIGKKLSSGNAHNLDPQRLQLRVAIDITLWPIAARMRLTIDLERDFGFGTIEIEDISSHRMLTPKLHDPGTSAEALPQQHLGQAHAFS